MSRLGGRPLERPITETATEPTAGSFSDAVLKRGGYANVGGFARPISEVGRRDPKVLAARAALDEEIARIDDELVGNDRIWAIAGVLGDHIDDLHPVEDAEMIAMGRDILKQVYGR